MKKKLLSFVLVTILLLTTFSFVACRSNDEEIDESKTQLKIGCWDGGFGIEWLTNIAKEFEEMYKDYSFEEGKKGVQVWVTATKSYVYDDFASNIVNATDDICISEQCNYRSFVMNNSALDITDAVTTPLTEYGESRTIVDKLGADDEAYFAVSKDGATHYYGLPWYESTFGFQYDIDFFEEENLYFATKGQGDANGFVRSTTEPRGTGPDGVSGTYDDGLPATYEQFFKLCDKISSLGNAQALIWAGSVPSYINCLVSALAADYEGYEQYSLNYTLDGVATNLIKSIDAQGNIEFYPPTTITNQNGYLLRNQAGYYYACKFIEKMLTTKTNGSNPVAKYYDASRCFSQTDSQTTAQSNFLRGGAYSEGKLDNVGMLIDGSWWYSEASNTFKTLESQGGGSLDRRIGFMPMPKVDENHLGSATYYNNWLTSVNIKSTIESSLIPCAKQFIRFMHSDESLSEFTKVTSGVRPYSYQLTAEDEPLTSYYGKQLLEIHNKNTKENPCIVNPWSTNSLIMNNLSSFMLSDSVFYSTVNNMDYNIIATAMVNHGVSGKDYFLGLAKYRDKSYWESNFSNYFNK